jgi:hypothetical protein
VRSSRRGSSTPWRQAVVGFLWKHGCEGGTSIARVAQWRRAMRLGLASSFVPWLGRCPPQPQQYFFHLKKENRVHGHFVFYRETRE